MDARISCDVYPLVVRNGDCRAAARRPVYKLARADNSRARVRACVNTRAVFVRATEGDGEPHRVCTSLYTWVKKRIRARDLFFLFMGFPSFLVEGTNVTTHDWYPQAI